MAGNEIREDGPPAGRKSRFQKGFDSRGKSQLGGAGHHKVCACKQSKDPVTAEHCLILGVFQRCVHHTWTQAIHWNSGSHLRQRYYGSTCEFLFPSPIVVLEKNLEIVKGKWVWLGWENILKILKGVYNNIHEEAFKWHTRAIESVFPRKHPPKLCLLRKQVIPTLHYFFVAPNRLPTAHDSH